MVKAKVGAEPLPVEVKLKGKECMVLPGSLPTAATSKLYVAAVSLLKVKANGVPPTLGVMVAGENWQVGGAFDPHDSCTG